jgi:hypothetical protein
MGLSHIILVLWEVLPMGVVIPLYILRGITFPIMAFFITEGFIHTSNIKRYMLRLFIFGLIAQVPYTLAFQFNTLNIIFSMFIGLSCLVLYDKWFVNPEKPRITLFVIVFIAILILATIIAEGGFFGILLIFLFYVIKNQKKRKTIPLIAWGLFTVLNSVIVRAMASPELAETLLVAGGGAAVRLEMMMMFNFAVPIVVLGTFLVIPLLRAYNGDRGRKAKYLFYIFYPAHLAILAAISIGLGLTEFGFSIT